jgi:hypothetical protein
MRNYWRISAGEKKDAKKRRCSKRLRSIIVAQTRMTNYVTTIRVSLFTFKKFQDDESGGSSEVIGYYRVHALLAVDEGQARQLIETSVTDGRIDWNDSTLRICDANVFAKDKKTKPPKKSQTGIWYSSGRAYFPAEE